MREDVLCVSNLMIASNAKTFEQHPPNMSVMMATGPNPETVMGKREKAKEI